MKKSLLIGTTLLISAYVVNAQNQRLTVKPSSLAHKSYPILKNLPTDGQFPTAPASQNSGHKNLSVHKSPSAITDRLIGYTEYDAETNSSMPRSIINHGDGTLSFVWTTDPDGLAGFPKRGSAYNYWTGTSLLFPPPSARIESVRTGYSQIATLANGKDVIFAHLAAPYDFEMSTSAKGTGVWTSVAAGATLPLPVSSDQTHGLWGRIATGGADGNSIHLINGYFTGAGSAMGILTPSTYSRSLDGGQSWNDQSVMLPGFDSTHVQDMGAEEYAIDAEGSNVAIVYAGRDHDVVLWKSTDNGANFTRTSVDAYAYEPTIDSAAVGTMTQSNDGAVSVVVGSNGTAHVAYSTTHLDRHLDATSGQVVTGFYPSDAELIYWNDVAKQKIHIAITDSIVDSYINGGNNNHVWEVGQYTDNGGTTSGLPSARYSNLAFLTIPNVSVDGDNVFILFSLVSDADSTDDGQSFRDIWVVASSDGGKTFGKVQNITCSMGEEEFYCSMAKKVDDKLHFTFLKDNEPGTNVGNADPVSSSEVHYGTVDKAKVLAGLASCNSGDGIAEYTNSVFSTSGNYPNPANAFTYFDINMKQNAYVSLEIFNSLGQQVYASSERLSTGKRTLSVDASKFSSGLYLYTIKSGDAVVSGKMTVVAQQ